jgi:hypothetical protein
VLKKAVEDKSPEGTFPDKGRRTTMTGTGATTEAFVEHQQGLPRLSIHDAYFHDFHMNFT